MQTEYKKNSYERSKRNLDPSHSRGYPVGMVAGNRLYGAPQEGGGVP
jgi:hypothetical protein